MKMIIIYSIRGELNDAIPPVFVEMPPVDIVDMAWQIESK
jgi:hypothetical protein